MMSLTKKTPNNSCSIDLTIPMSESAEIWHKAQKQSNTLARYNAYLNRLSVATVLPWLEDFMSEESIPQPSIGCTEESLSTVFELVNGTAIQCGEKRLVLIPTEELDDEKFIVPQEWVDIPSWRGDYYLAVGVNLDGDEEDCWIRLWGFATHQQLKSEGEYDVNLRSYRLKLDQLIQDFTVMQLMWGLRRKEAAKSLSNLSAAEARRLIQNLGNSGIYSPRLQLQVPFEKWAALLENDQWRQELYDRRMGKLVGELVADTAVAATPKKDPMNLRQWLHNLADDTQQAIADGWGNLEELFSEPQLSPVRGVRGRTFAPQNSETNLGSIVRLLDSNQKDLRYNAVGVLGELGYGNPEAIAALTGLLKTETDKKVCKKAAISLGKIDPGNYFAGIQQAKLINFGMQLQDQQVALIVAIMPQRNDRLRVFVEVQSQKAKKLPPNLKLSILSESGEVIHNLEVESRSDGEGGIDDSIQLKSFTPPSGTYFRVKVELNGVSMIEDFEV